MILFAGPDHPGNGMVRDQSMQGSNDVSDEGVMVVAAIDYLGGVLIVVSRSDAGRRSRSSD